MSSYLKEYLEQKMDVSNEELEHILICFKKLNAKKSQILVEQNKVCKQLFFIKKDV